jgi:hypothetical protein
VSGTRHWIIVLGLFVSATTGFASGRRSAPVEFCLDLFGERAGTIHDFNVWKSLHVEDLLPDSFITRYREAGRELSIDVLAVGERPGDTKAYFATVAIYTSHHGEADTIIRLHLIPGSRPELVRVEGLSAADPLADEKRVQALLAENPDANPRYGLHPAQGRRGLPSDIFKYVRERVQSLLTLQGYSGIEMSSSQNYLVAMLYRRGVGKIVMSAESQAFYTQIDALYPLAAKLPNETRVKSLNEFTRLLGDASFIDPSVQNLQFAVETSGGWLAPSAEVIQRYGLEIYRHPDGAPWFVVSRSDLGHPRSEPLRAFIGDVEGTTQILDWKTLDERHGELMRFEIPLR